MKPTRGRIVDFGLFEDIDGELTIYPAIITRVITTGKEANRVNLAVFGMEGYPPTMNFHDVLPAHTPQHRRWSWPVRESDDTKT